MWIPGTWIALNGIRRYVERAERDKAFREAYCRAVLEEERAALRGDERSPQGDPPRVSGAGRAWVIVCLLLLLALFGAAA